MKDASLVVVGTGIKFISHLTVEAKAYIEQSNKVLYLVNEPLMEKWIQETNNNTQSLSDIYKSFELRLHSYTAITDYILKNLYTERHVCVAIYGHPAMYAKPALDAVIKAKAEGYYAKILPGISAEACLFSDLLIDPASHGCISLDATDLLIKRRKLDPSFHTIIWQIGVIGSVNHPKFWNNETGLKLLYEYLLEYYDNSHVLISYSASQYPGVQPIINKLCLNELPLTRFSRVSSLYIPPSSMDSYDTEMMKSLNLSINQLRLAK